MDLKKLKYILKKIDESKARIAKERDSLREIFGELESELESFDRGIECLESGKREIEDGIDAISETV